MKELFYRSNTVLDRERVNPLACLRIPTDFCKFWIDEFLSDAVQFSSELLQQICSTTAPLNQ